MQLIVCCLLYVSKPKTQQGRRVLEARESKIIENTKQTMVMKGAKCSESVNNALKDLVRDNSVFNITNYIALATNSCILQHLLSSFILLS